MIRPARAADLPAMAAFAAGWTAQQLAEELAQPLARVLVWEEAGQVVGHALGWAVAGECQIHEVAVAPGARRRGLGRQLVLALLDACGPGPAHLEVRASNAAAIALYRSLDFAEVGRRRRYYKDGEDALLMARSI